MKWCSMNKEIGTYNSVTKCEDCLRRLCCPCAGGCKYFKVTCNGICVPKKQRNREANKEYVEN